MGGKGGSCLRGVVSKCGRDQGARDNCLFSWGRTAVLLGRPCVGRCASRGTNFSMSGVCIPPRSMWVYRPNINNNHTSTTIKPLHRQQRICRITNPNPTTKHHTTNININRLPTSKQYSRPSSKQEIWKCKRGRRIPLRRIRHKLYQ